ncbi:UDP-N-acetylmuramoyl-L-alanyl-D-glutamate--2,6-diaminopimelate ligase [Priestia endophytica]|uniref:UDP-N-acetylmuramoyl-L-alanyl-D-glutamate--2, 6-diaminopimelate ligase n=1 Tax=Priestia endophytica TaxID=135735 RepID=UPI000DCA8A33|nr:UDP-N-acetylmuramoyl-L-alanyl-D-glutamate--2,6-diaminopimelate ligase [Priestia endophytica]RAS79796.1 UDP-N-acetylmuramoyl-L-alanyl-D-glutamate--2,6-diaminopimelate ligase [Priestia endophytica]
MKLTELINVLPKWQFNVTSNENPEITSLKMDSREVEEGSLFFCVKGYTVDGHDYAKTAVEKGAVALVAEHELDVDIPVVIVKDTRRVMALLANFFYGQPTKKLKLIGVTGTNGKTTVTHLLEAIFQEKKQKTGVIGTIETRIGSEVYPVQNTTPESLALQGIFSKMVDENVEVAAMEVSSHALDLGRVHGCDYDVAVFTNLTQDHLDYHHTMEEYRYAKGLLFSQLGNRFEETSPKYAVLNADDASSKLYAKMTTAFLLTYGIHEESDIMARNIEMTSSGTTFELVTPLGNKTMHVNLIGEFSIYNILAAASAAFALNVDLETIVAALSKVKGVDGRFEVVNGGQDYTVIVDYAHTPDSLENVLKTVKQFAEQNIYVIVGCGGDRDKTKRPIMANVAVSYSTEAIFTSDNPRSEDPKEILNDMTTELTEENFTTIEDRREAIQYAINKAQAKDVIVIAGKGHETYQIIGGTVNDFDDRKVALESIESKTKQA